MMSFRPTSSRMISNIGCRQLLSRRSPTRAVSRSSADRVWVVDSHSVLLRSANATKSATCCPSRSMISTSWPVRTAKAAPCPPEIRISRGARSRPCASAAGLAAPSACPAATEASLPMARIVRHIQSWGQADSPNLRENVPRPSQTELACSVTGLTPGPRTGPGRVRGRLLDQRCELGGRDLVHQVEVPLRVVGPDLEAAARVVPLVEGDDAGGADVIDLLAGFERREAFRVRMHLQRPRGGRGERRDGRIPH